MKINGYRLIKKSDGSVIEQWRAIPPRIELMGNDGDCLLRVDAAEPSWSDHLYSIETASWEEPDHDPAQELTPSQKLATIGLSVADLKTLLRS